MEIETLKPIVEGVLLASGGPMSLNQINALFPDDEKPGHGAIKQALAALDADLEGRAVQLVEVGSGYRIQIRSQFMPVVSRLWSEKPPRYSRALLETLAIIAYRQPITRGDIEQIRGVAVSSNILRTLQEREWIKVVGHRDVPGRPELLGTTKAFLDYFNLKSLDQLPTLAEIKDIDNLEPELELTHPEPPEANKEAVEEVKEEPVEGDQAGDDTQDPARQADETKDNTDDASETPQEPEQEGREPRHAETGPDEKREDEG
ncbi:MAG: SMC-Scp complex subunit ScpB [Pseudomonadota bacterium]